MDNRNTAQPVNPSSSSNETITDTKTSTTNTYRTDSSVSYCPDCPICNPPDKNTVSTSTYGTIEHHSQHAQLPNQTFFEVSLEACADICCYICDSPSSATQTSEWSSTTYPSSISSDSYSYETETGLSSDQASDTATMHARNPPRDNDGYIRQQEMRSTKDEIIVQIPQKSFQRSG